MCLITLSLGGCIIPIHVDEEEPYAEVTAEFLEALTEVEKLESPDGPTWGELLGEGKLEGVKVKK